MLIERVLNFSYRARNKIVIEPANDQKVDKTVYSDPNNDSEERKIYIIIIHQICSLARDWSKHVRWPNIAPAKTGPGCSKAD